MGGRQELGGDPSKSHYPFLRNPTPQIILTAMSTSLSLKTNIKGVFSWYFILLPQVYISEVTVNCPFAVTVREFPDYIAKLTILKRRE